MTEEFLAELTDEVYADCLKTIKSNIKNGYSQTTYKTPMENKTNAWNATVACGEIMNALRSKEGYVVNFKWPNILYILHNDEYNRIKKKNAQMLLKMKKENAYTTYLEKQYNNKH